MRLLWIFVGVLAVSALVLLNPPQAQAVTADYMGANHRQDGYLDFNGDHKTDIFRTNGQSWQVSYGGTSTWQTLKTSSWQLENGLCFGDFDGNGKTDVFLTWNDEWLVSYDGTSAFNKINGSGYKRTDLAFGDFNGDRRTDVFVANGAAWYVSYGGTSAWVKINTSGYKTMELALGDFDGDGRTDVLRASGAAWYVSYAGSSAFKKINTSSLELGYLVYGVGYFQGDMGLGDFDGDGKTDIFKADGSHWYVSYGGTSSWSNLVTWVYEPDDLYFADLDGDGRTDIFKEVWGPRGWMVWFNELSPYGSSSMRKKIIYPTAPPPDRVTPVISEVKVESLAPTSAIVTWTTDEPATSQVRFGMTTSYGQSTWFDTNFTTSHRVSLAILGLTELTPDTLYYFRVESKDAAGNLAWADGTFTTPPPPTTTTTTLPPTTTTTTTTPQPGTTTTTLPPVGTTTTTTPQGERFGDVSNSPYRDQIYDLANRGVISGYPDDTFRPHNPVIRQQFAKMIAKALELPVSTGDACPFVDVAKSEPGSYVDPSDPYYPDHYVAVCTAQGITGGKTPITFAPYDNITGQQLITMIVRAAGLSDPPTNYTPPFMPGQFFPEEHYLNARKAAHAGLLDGLQGLGSSYDFFAPASRGEVCLLLYNLLHP